MARLCVVAAAAALLLDTTTAGASPLSLVQVSARLADSAAFSKGTRDEGTDDQHVSDLPEFDGVMTNTSAILQVLTPQTMVLRAFEAKIQEARKAASAERLAKFAEEGHWSISKPEARHRWPLPRSGVLNFVKVNGHPRNAAMSGWPEVTKLASDPHVVVTLTTTPGSYESLQIALDSLLSQRYKPDEIHANIPFESARGLGPYPDIAPFEPYMKKGVQIHRTQDWGSLTNILPTRQRFRANRTNTLIIVVDDDKVLPPTLVEDHVRAHRKNPNAAYTCRGYRVTRGMASGDHGAIRNELEISVYGHTLAEEQQVGVVTGSDTWSVPADALKRSLWKSLGDMAPKPWDDFPIGLFAKRMNDIWVSGLLAKANWPKYVMPCREEVWDTPEWSQHGYESVEDTEAEAKPLPVSDRDVMNSVVMEYFKGSWKSEELRAL